MQDQQHVEETITVNGETHKLSDFSEKVQVEVNVYKETSAKLASMNREVYILNHAIKSMEAGLNAAIEEELKEKADKDAEIERQVQERLQAEGEKLDVIEPEQ